MSTFTKLDYIGALIRTNIKASTARPMLTLTTAAMMIGNNFILFMVWVIYFAKFSSIRGWGIQDMATLLGVVAWAAGLTFLLAGGVRDLARTIVDGGLDVYLGRPRHPLPGLLISRSIPSGLGDMTSAFVFWLWFGRHSISELPLLLIVSTSAAIVFAATLTISQCLVFWFPRALSFCEDIFNMVLMLAFYPQHTYGLFVRLILFTAFPIAFISLLPTQAVREHSWLLASVGVAAAVVYSLLAMLIFNRGLRRYASGNRIVELR